ncbi:MAG TPA: 30S ribosomal protein S9 [Pseudonocardiaceae bacterium]|nr:30S ribosomal protein S9 [Pseudonocardiaceae bacterium]
MTNPEIADQPQPDQAAPSQTAPSQTAPGQTAPGQTAPGQASSEAAAAGADTNEQSKPSRPVASDARAQTVGRRKEAIVRVRLVPGSGNFNLNGRTLEQYFPNKVHQQLIREPLVTTERTDSYDVIANLRGGGTTGQAGALRLALARALVELDADDRPALKKAGFLTRDARVKERKKYGLKKARKAPQYSKR